MDFADRSARETFSLTANECSCRKANRRVRCRIAQKFPQQATIFTAFDNLDPGMAESRRNATPDGPGFSVCLEEALKQDLSGDFDEIPNVFCTHQRRVISFVEKSLQVPLEVCRYVLCELRDQSSGGM